MPDYLLLDRMLPSLFPPLLGRGRRYLHHLWQKGRSKLHHLWLRRRYFNDLIFITIKKITISGHRRYIHIFTIFLGKSTMLCFTHLVSLLGLLPYKHRKDRYYITQIIQVTYDKSKYMKQDKYSVTYNPSFFSFFPTKERTETDIKFLNTPHHHNIIQNL